MNPAWSFAFPESRWYCWHLAGADIFVRRTGSRWQSFCRPLRWDERSGECSGPVPEDPDPAAVLNNAVGEAAPLQKAPLQKALLQETALLPCFPEKPFLIDLQGLRLFPGRELSLELQLPPLFRLIPVETVPVKTGAQSEAPEILFTFAPFIVKETWYGKDTMDGFLCSSLSAPLKAGTPKNAAGINCTVLIRNRTGTVLEMGKVPFYTDVLAVYEANGTFISDKPVIDFYGENFRILVMPEQGTLLTPASKSETGDTLIHWGRQVLRHITGI